MIEVDCSVSVVIIVVSGTVEVINTVVVSAAVVCVVKIVVVVIVVVAVVVTVADDDISVAHKAWPVDSKVILTVHRFLRYKAASNTDKFVVTV